MARTKADRTDDIIAEISRLIIQDTPAGSARLGIVRRGLMRLTHQELESLHAVLMFQEW